MWHIGQEKGHDAEDHEQRTARANHAAVAPRLGEARFTGSFSPLRHTSSTGQDRETTRPVEAIAEVDSVTVLSRKIGSRNRPSTHCDTRLGMMQT
jgi:hypothetical protein